MCYGTVVVNCARALHNILLLCCQYLRSCTADCVQSRQDLFAGYLVPNLHCFWWQVEVMKSLDFLCLWISLHSFLLLLISGAYRWTVMIFIGFIAETYYSASSFFLRQHWFQSSPAVTLFYPFQPSRCSVHLPPSRWSVHLPLSHCSVHLPPPHCSVHFPPSHCSVHLPPSRCSVHLLPSHCSVHLPPSRCSVHLPPSHCSVHLPPPHCSVHFPPSHCSVHLPPSRCSVHLPPSRCQTLSCHQLLSRFPASMYFFSLVPPIFIFTLFFAPHHSAFMLTSFTVAVVIPSCCVIVVSTSFPVRHLHIQPSTCPSLRLCWVSVAFDIHCRLCNVFSLLSICLSAVEHPTSSSRVVFIDSLGRGSFLQLYCLDDELMFNVLRCHLTY